MLIGIVNIMKDVVHRIAFVLPFQIKMINYFIYNIFNPVFIFLDCITPPTPISLSPSQQGHLYNLFALRFFVHICSLLLRYLSHFFSIIFDAAIL